MNRTIDRICDDFEQAWQRNEPFSIEDAMERCDGASRERLADELIGLEVALRRAAGEKPLVSDYAARFPKCTSAIHSAFLHSTTINVLNALNSSTCEDTTDFSDNRNSENGQRTPGPGIVVDRQTIGRYTIIGKLGSGGQADVYRAVHPTLPIEVAIKLSHFAISAKAREALREEAHILSDLDHPNIARIRDFDFDEGRPFMVLDFIRGRSLGQIAAVEPLSADAAAKLVALIARAIGFAHSRGVIHRDLKPENIVIDESGQPKIIDFGMSRMRSGIAGGQNEANEISGTLAYMAPEQAHGITANTDHRVDVFALGAILYRLLVGKAPYTGSSLSQLLERVRRGDFDGMTLKNMNVHESYKKICFRAMAKEPDQRFATAELMARILDDVAEKSTRAISKKRIWLPILGCLATLVFVGMIAWRSASPSTVSKASVLNSDSPEAATTNLIRDFQIIHVIPDPASPDHAEFAVPLLEKGPPQQNHGIQVMASFTQPVYCYLVALNPDGVKQLCYPIAGDELQTEPIWSLRYPNDEDSAFGLTDGAGSQAFVLLTSLEPLPIYDDWQSEFVNATWPDPNVSGNWTYKSGKLVSFDDVETRNRGIEITLKMPKQFKRHCDQLRTAGKTDVCGVIFQVEPK